ncbi:MAG: hypothetical protein AAF203_05440 [Pseudomonadota bacterium]
MNSIKALICLPILFSAIFANAKIINSRPVTQSITENSCEFVLDIGDSVNDCYSVFNRAWTDSTAVNVATSCANHLAEAECDDHFALHCFNFHHNTGTVGVTTATGPTTGVRLPIVTCTVSVKREMIH